MHELFEHTADLGLRATATDLDTLFAEMGKCLLSAIVEDPASVQPRQETSILISGEEADYLLFDWLQRLLYLFEAEKQLFVTFEVKVSGFGLSATARGEPFDPARHVLAHEVKAITYHELKVEPVEGGWLAEVIVDI